MKQLDVLSSIQIEKRCSIIREIKKTALLCLIGGLIYCWIEFFWRGWTHWSMLLVAMMLSILLDQINERLPWDCPFFLQAIAGGMAITAVELVAGFILNVWLGLDVWDYTDLPWNLWGQICLKYSVLWVILAGMAIILFDVLRWILFSEKKPRYTWWFHSKKKGELT